MAFPTIVVLDGTGVQRTINTWPNAGQNTLANSVSVGIASDQSIIPVTSNTSGSISNPTSTLTRPSNTTAYAAGQLIANDTNHLNVVVPSFALLNSAGGAMPVRLRLQTSVTTGWGGINLSINLWSAAPTYTNGDGGAWAPATGSASWLANFVISLTQMGDGAVGAGAVSNANEMAIKKASGTAVFWDIQILSAATPATGQTFTLTAELLN